MPQGNRIAKTKFYIIFDNKSVIQTLQLCISFGISDILP